MNLTSVFTISLFLVLGFTFDVCASDATCSDVNWQGCITDLISRGRYDTAYHSLLPIAEKGNSDAQIGIAILLNAEPGLSSTKKMNKKDRELLALPWIEKSATAKNPEALAWLADGYKFGWFNFAINEPLSTCIKLIKTSSVGAVSECRKRHDK